MPRAEDPLKVVTGFLESRVCGTGWTESIPWRTLLLGPSEARGLESKDGGGRGSVPGVLLAGGGEGLGSVAVVGSGTGGLCQGDQSSRGHWAARTGLSSENPRKQHQSLALVDSLETSSGQALGTGED